MMRVCDSGHPPRRVESGSPCRACASLRSRAREATRPSRRDRGYDAAHDAARRALAASGDPCAYCGQPIAGRFDAAHAVDGHPEFGWMRAHPECNQRARLASRRRAGADGGPGNLTPDRGTYPRPRHLAKGTGLARPAVPGAEG